MPSRRQLVLRALLAGAAVLGCTSPKSCPTTDCAPTITLTYRQPIAGEYAILISLLAVTYQATCPRGMSGPGTSDAAIAEVTCDADGAVLYNVDLGHADNDTQEMVVELITGDAAKDYMVTATLTSIANSTNCQVVCTRHTATVGN
jgi:hypothetical protein